MLGVLAHFGWHCLCSLLAFNKQYECEACLHTHSHPFNYFLSRAISRFNVSTCKTLTGNIKNGQYNNLAGNPDCPIMFIAQ